MVSNSDVAGPVRFGPSASCGSRIRFGLALCVVAALASGCVDSGVTRQDVTQSSMRSDQHVAAFSSQYVLSGAYLADWQSAFRADTTLQDLARRANDMTIARSPTVFELRAAEAESAAARAAWFPNIRPVATAGLGGVSSGVGLSITQLIYDFSQTRNRREQAEIERVLTELALWAERNDDVLDALSGYIDAIEANEIILARSLLEDRLAALASREAERLAAGVVAQGDALFVDVSRQENRREMIRARADLAEARAQLQQDTGVYANGQMPLRFSALRGACEAPARPDYSPEVLRAQIAVELTQLEETEARRALFPRIVGEASIRSTEGGALEDAGQITLEGGSIAGGGGRLRIEAAQQRVFAVEREMTNVRTEMTRELERLTAEQRLLQSQRADYGDLIRTNEQSLDLFQDRFAAGAAATSEAVRLEVERTANLIAVIDTNAMLARNCLNAARLFGALADADLGSL